MQISSLTLEDKIMELERACRERGVPVTTQRRVIMGILADRRDHPTAEDIYEAAHRALPAISRTTVYRALDAFVEMGVIRRISGCEARFRFDADTRRHHHLQCLECGRVVDCHSLEFDKLPPPETVPAGFRIIDYSISYTGICSNCAAPECGAGPGNSKNSDSEDRYGR